MTALDTLSHVIVSGGRCGIIDRLPMNNGYDSFVMINVYAQRATSPKDMALSCHTELHRQNLEAFRYALSLSEEPAVWAAWGNIIEMRPYLKECLRELITVSFEFGTKWYRCGAISKKGHPHHPLYLRKDAPLEVFDMKNYIDELVESSG